MAKVAPEELYALFYALHQHQNGKVPISGVSLQGEVLEAVERFARKHEANLVRPEAPLTIDRIRNIVKLAKHDNDIRIVLCEDGPDARRPKTDDELLAEDVERESEMAHLVRRFWISASFGLVALMTAFTLRWWVDMRKRHDYDPDAGPTLTAVDVPEIDPMQLLFVGLVLAATWGIVDAFMIAKDNWLDFDRAREAVPLVGHRWIARVRRKRREREQTQQDIN